MQATYHDGRTARAQPVEVRADDEALIFKAAGEQRLPLAALRVERIHDRVRVAPPGDDPARLTLALGDWLNLTEHAQAHHQAERRRHIPLVGGLAAVALSVAGVVFVGIPAASGPLARATPPALESRIGQNMDA